MWNDRTHANAQCHAKPITLNNGNEHNCACAIVHICKHAHTHTGNTNNDTTHIYRTTPQTITASAITPPTTTTTHMGVVTPHMAIPLIISRTHTHNDDDDNNTHGDSDTNNDNTTNHSTASHTNNTCVDNTNHINDNNTPWMPHIVHV